LVILVIATRSKRCRDATNESTSVSGTKLQKVLELFPRPFLYLVERNRSALYSPARGFDYSKLMQGKLMYTTPEFGILIPEIHFNKSGKRVYLGFEAFDLERADNVSIGMVLHRSRLVLPVFMPHELPRMYTFPPTTLSSYIFLHFNPPIADTVTEFLNRYSSSLPESFISSLELYKNLEDGIGNNIEILHVKPSSVDRVSINIIYYYMKERIYRRVSLKEIIMEYAIGNYSGEWKEDIKFSAILSVPGGDHIVETRHAKTLAFITSVAGAEEDMMDALKRLSNLYTVMSRGALLFDAKKRLEEL